MTKIKASVKRQAWDTLDTSQQILLGEQAGVSQVAVANLLNLAQVPKVVEPAENSTAEKKVRDCLNNTS